MEHLRESKRKLGETIKQTAGSMGDMAARWITAGDEVGARVSAEMAAHYGKQALKLGASPEQG